MDLSLQSCLLMLWKFLVSPLQEIHNHHITTREPWVLRLLHGSDCFMVSILCMYTDLGSREYFGVYCRPCFRLRYCPCPILWGWHFKPKIDLKCKWINISSKQLRSTCNFVAISSLTPPSSCPWWHSLWQLLWPVMWITWDYRHFGKASQNGSIWIFLQK